VVHMRFWVVPALDAQGRMVLWIGGTANRNRDAFEQKFQKLVGEIKKELKPQPVAAASRQATTFAVK